MRDRYFSLVAEVFSLMMENKLREDIDDTLLEKLLSIINTEIHNECFLNDLVNIPQCLNLCETALSSLHIGVKDLSTSIVVFSLKLLGIIFQNPITFLSLKNSAITYALSSIINSNTLISYSPSIQDAVLSSLMSLAKHIEGASWLIDQNFINYVFSSFASSSYYVKKTGAKCFSESFQLWSTPEFSESIPSSSMNYLTEARHKLISKLITGIQPIKDYKTENISNCCILTLKQMVESGVDFQKVNFQLIQALTKYFEKINKYDKHNQDAIDLFVTVLNSDHSQSYNVIKVVQILIKDQIFTTAFYLISTYLRTSRYHQPVSSKNLYLFLMPFFVTCEEKLHLEEDDVFGLKPEEVNGCLKNEMSNKSGGLLIMSVSLVSLTKLTPVMNVEAIKSMLHSLSLAFLLSPDENDYFSYSLLENGRICLALLELLSSLYSSEIYTKMDFLSQMKLFELLIMFLKKPFANSNIVSEALHILKTALTKNAQQKIVLDSTVAQTLIQLLCRKLLDCKEPIVDNALHLAGEIMVGKDYEFWKETVIIHSVLLIVWDIAIDGHHEGVIKASALKVITDACLKSDYFSEIKSTKGIDEIKFMKILCDYFQDPDFFVQRESILCACNWMKSKAHLLPRNSKFDLFNILQIAIQSLDLDLKLATLEQYQDLIENDAIFPLLSQVNIISCFESYASSYFISGVLFAMEDSDESVKYKAAKILFDLRNKLSQLGISKDYFDIKELKTAEAVKPKISQDLFLNSVSTEERDKGIDDVMMMSTTQQLLNICKTTDPPITNLISCSTLEEEKDEMISVILPFWQCLWSDDYVDILSTEKVKEVFYSDYSLSVLEDILAAEKTDLILPANDTPDCY